MAAVAKLVWSRGLAKESAVRGTHTVAIAAAVALPSVAAVAGMARISDTVETALVGSVEAVGAVGSVGPDYSVDLLHHHNRKDAYSCMPLKKRCAAVCSTICLGCQEKRKERKPHQQQLFKTR